MRDFGFNRYFSSLGFPRMPMPASRPRRQDHCRVEALEHRRLLSGDVNWPADTGMIDITAAPYSANKTGSADDTNAIQRAIFDNIHTTNSIYFPDGTYKVSRTLNWTTNWVRGDLGSTQTNLSLKIAWKANTTYYFSVDVSTDGTHYTTAFTGNSAGGATTLENVSLGSGVSARYVKIIGLGSSLDAHEAIAEVQAFSSTTQVPFSGFTSGGTVIATNNSLGALNDGSLSTYWDGFEPTCRLAFLGQSETATIIKLANSAAGFTNAASPMPVIMTGYTGNNPNESFFNSFQNLTIDTGSGNSGAIGLNYLISNEGAVRNVTIKSDDLAGVIGLNMPNAPGPGLVSNVEVDGFQTGISVSSGEYSMTFKNITLNNQSQVGFNGGGNTSSIENLTTNETSNSVIPLELTSRTGLLTLIGGTFHFTGGGSTVPHGINIYGTTDGLYVRNVSITTAAEPSAAIAVYATQTATTLAAGTVTGSASTGWTTTLGEYSDTSTSLFDSAQKMLDLTIQDYTDYHDNTLADWYKVTAAPGQDDTAAIQSALNAAATAGATTVYFPHSSTASYLISSTITVPGSIQAIEGMDDIIQASGPAFDNPANPIPMFKIQGGTASQLLIDQLIFDDGGLRGVVSIDNTSTHALALRDGQFAGYENSTGAGALYLEDVDGTGWVFNGESVWARQLNPETIQGVKIQNIGGNFWVLGLKTEVATTVLSTTNGGKSEVLGAYIFENSGTHAVPIFKSVDSQMSLSYDEFTYNAQTASYAVQVEETRSGVTRDLYQWDAPTYNSMFVGTTQTPTRDVPVDTITNLTNGQLFTAGSNIPINATVTDADATIVSTNIYQIPSIGLTGGSTAVALVGSGTSATLSNAAPGDYRFYVKSVDSLGAVGISPVVQITVKPNTASTGSLLREYYENLLWPNPAAPGTYVSPLEDDPRFPNSPTLWDFSTTFSTTQLGRNNGMRMRGWVTAPTTGNYTFSISGSKEAVLWLSTDSTLLNKREIAADYNDTTTNHWVAANTSAPISLVAGQRYYIEAQLAEGGGDGGHMEVGWTTPGAGSAVAIPAADLSPWDNSAPDPVNTLPPGEIKLQPSKDTYIRGGGTTNVNYGTLNSMTTQTSGGFSLLNFDLSSLPATITSATLYLYPVLVNIPAGSSAPTNQLNLLSNDAWTEDSVTYGNYGSNLASGTAIGSPFVPVQSSWTSVDITSAVQGQLAGDKSLSLDIASTGTDSKPYVNYVTKEELVDWRPYLLIQTPTGSVNSFDFSQGFNGNGLTLNGGAAYSGIALQLTDGGNFEARSAFYSDPVPIDNFTTDFQLQFTNATADGMTFTIQNVASTGVGSVGSGLGYQGINTSAAIKFDLYSNNGEGTDSTGLYLNGAAPTNAGSIDLSATGINWHNGDAIDVHITYDGTTLTVLEVDDTTNATATQNYAVDLPGTMGGSSAYIGFTAGTGGKSAVQQVLGWSYDNRSNAYTDNSGLVSAALNVSSPNYLLADAANSGLNSSSFNLPATPSGYTWSVTSTDIELNTSGPIVMRQSAVSVANSQPVFGEVPISNDLQKSLQDFDWMERDWRNSHGRSVKCENETFENLASGGRSR